MRKAHIALLLIMALGGGLRFFRIGHSLRIDEAETWVYSQRPLGHLVGVSHHPHPYVLARLGRELLGDGELQLRLPFVLYGMLSLPVLFLLGKRLFGEDEGLIASLLLAGSLMHVRYSQEARHYPLFVAYSLCMLYFLLMAVDAPRERRKTRMMCGALFVSASALNILTLRFALYPLALCLIVACFVQMKRSDARLKQFVVPVLAGAGLLAAAFHLSYSSSDGILEFFRREFSGQLTLRQSYLDWHLRPRGSILADFAEEFGGSRAAAWVFPALCAAAPLVHGKKYLRGFSIIGAWIGLPLTSLFIFKSRMHFELRYFIFLLPVYLLWVASGITAIVDSLSSRLRNPHPFVRPVLLVLGAGIILSLSGSGLFEYYRLPKSRLREALARINDECSPGDAVIPYPPWDIYWYNYYPLREGCQVFQTETLIPGKNDRPLLEVFRKHPRIWLAATWIRDPIRAEEFGRLLREVSRYYVLERTWEFRARPENDDFVVYRFRRGGRIPLRAGDAESDDFPFRPRKGVLLGNIEDSIAALMSGRTPETWKLSSDIKASLIRMPPGLRLHEKKSLRQNLFFVWAGNVAWETNRGRKDIKKGGLLLVPPGEEGTWNALPGEPSVVLRISAPSAGAVADSSRRPRNERLSIAVRRTPPGASTVDDENAATGSMLLFRLVLQGRLSVKWPGAPVPLFLREGDLYKLTVLGQPVWPEFSPSLTYVNPGPEDAIELQVMAAAPPSEARYQGVPPVSDKLVGGPR